MTYPDSRKNANQCNDNNQLDIPLIMGHLIIQLTWPSRSGSSSSGRDPCQLHHILFSPKKPGPILTNPIKCATDSSIDHFTR